MLNFFYKNDHDGTRTRSLQIRSLLPYPFWPRGLSINGNKNLDFFFHFFFYKN